MTLKMITRGTVEAVAFSWKPNSRVAIKPEDAYTELRKVYEKDLAVKPQAVVEAASDPDSKLHPAFEWDDGSAAQAYREDQARHMMRSLVVTYRKTDGELTPPIRAFVKLVSSADDPALDESIEEAVQPRVYLPLSQVMSEDEHRRRYTRQALSELMVWRRRYREIEQFARIFEVIDDLAKVANVS